MARRRRGSRGRTVVGRLADYLALLFLVSVVLFGISRLPVLDIVGGARVIDGDSLRVDGSEVRLFGIDAPEARQTCRDRDGILWDCGKEATQVLADLVTLGDVTCRSHDIDTYGRNVARCFAGDTDLSAEMVRLGMAVVLIDGVIQYGGLQKDARDTKRGIWRGTFDEPAEWRAAHDRNGG